MNTAVDSRADAGRTADGVELPAAPIGPRRARYNAVGRSTAPRRENPAYLVAGALLTLIGKARGRTFLTMIRRFRPLGALLALLALSAFVGEGVWNSMCPPVPGSDHEAATHAASGGEHHGSQHGSSEAPADPDRSHDDSHCPLGMAAGASCTAASLPAMAVSLESPPAVVAGGAFVIDTTRDRLPTATHFRPPRA
jgi:hypothetical protein